MKFFLKPKDRVMYLFKLNLLNLLGSIYIKFTIKTDCIVVLFSMDLIDYLQSYLCVQVGQSLGAVTFLDNITFFSDTVCYFEVRWSYLRSTKIKWNWSKSKKQNKKQMNNQIHWKSPSKSFWVLFSHTTPRY